MVRYIPYYGKMYLDNIVSVALGCITPNSIVWQCLETSWQGLPNDTMLVHCPMSLTVAQKLQHCIGRYYFSWTFFLMCRLMRARRSVSVILQQVGPKRERRGKEKDSGGHGGQVASASEDMAGAPNAEDLNRTCRWRPFPPVMQRLNTVYGRITYGRWPEEIRADGTAWDPYNYGCTAVMYGYGAQP